MKNDLTCAVARDLMPSYVDGLTSAESNEALERHVEGCADCRARLDAMRRPEETAAPAEEETAAREVDYLRSVRRKRRWSVAAAVICTALVLVCALAVKVFVIGAPARQNEFSYSISQTDNTLTVNARAVDYSFYRVAMGDGDVRIRDGAAYISVRTIPTGKMTAIDQNKTVEIDLTKVNEVYLCGTLIWQDGLIISQVTNRLYEHKVDYVGNASAVGALWDVQDRVYVPYTIALQTNAEPYGLTINYEKAVDGAGVASQMKRAGELTLALVGNLGEFHWNYKDSSGQSHSGTVTLEDINAQLPDLVTLYNQLYGTDWEPLASVKDYAASPATLQQLVELLGMPH